MDFFNNDIIQVILRCVISFSILFIVTKLLGKRQMSELSLFDYVVGISIGNFASEMAINLEADWLNAMTAIIVFGICAFLVSILTVKSIVLRRFFSGKPSVLIQHGKLMYDNMKKNKYDINDLTEEARSNGYFDLSEIEYAILEANGKVSFLPKGEYKNVTIKDMGLKVQKQGLCANVIIDGNIMVKHLENIGKDKEWLIHELDVKGKNIKDILLATADVSGNLVLYDKFHNEQVLEIFE